MSRNYGDRGCEVMTPWEFFQAERMECTKALRPKGMGLAFFFFFVFWFNFVSTVSLSFMVLNEYLA